MEADRPSRRQDLTLKTKYEVVQYIEKNPEESLASVGRVFSLPRTTVSGIASNASRIKYLVDNNEVSTSTKRVRKPTLEDVDTALLRWFSQLRSTQPDFPVSGEMLLDKAKQFASLSGTVSDKSVMLGPSWISRWKSRHGISSKKLVGEASSVDTLVVDEWLNTKLPLLMTEFPLVNIYNVDETGLFWK